MAFLPGCIVQTSDPASNSTCRLPLSQCRCRQNYPRDSFGTPASLASATALRALQLKLNAAANNLANAQTAGYKRMIVELADAAYREVTVVARGDTASVPIGGGVRVASIHADMTPGPVKETGRRLDLAIEGDGFFQVTAERSGEERTFYTRAGSFNLNNLRDWCMVGRPNYKLEPRVNIPEDAVEITVSETGIISVRTQGANELSECAGITLARFGTPEALRRIGGNLFDAADAAGSPILAAPGEDGMGAILQGYLELSNVDTTVEMLELSAVRRAYDLNARLLDPAWPPAGPLPGGREPSLAWSTSDHRPE